MTDITTPAKAPAAPVGPGLFAALRSGPSVAPAARLAGTPPNTVYSRANSNPAFAQCIADTRVAIRQVLRRRSGARTIETGLQERFLKTRAEKSKVSAGDWWAKVVPDRAYVLRRETREFAAPRLAALIESYQHLEMEVLGFLRDPEPTSRMNVASALRLLAAMARRRAGPDDRPR